jgi:hypothetical protein
LFSRHLRQGMTLLTVVCAFGVWAVPAHADDEMLRKELEAVKQRLEQVEKELAKNKKDGVEKSKNADGLKTPKGTRVLLSGFAQLRATNIGNSDSDRVSTLDNNDFDFQVTRFRPKLTFLMDDHWSAVFQMNASTRGGGAAGTQANINARDLFINYKNAGYFLQAGQQKIPFGYEVYREGDEARGPLERARVFSKFFPDERDIGLVVGTAPKNPHAANFHIGVVNGDGINRSDGDADKSVVGKVEVPIGKLMTLGASGYTGTATFAKGGRAKEAVGVEHRFNLGRFSTQLEYLWGHQFGKDLNGGLGMATYNTGRVGNFFARYDVFDPNTQAANDYWSRTSLGWFKDFTKQIRLTAEYDIVRNRLTHTSNDNTWGIQVQANF